MRVNGDGYVDMEFKEGDDNRFPELQAISKFGHRYTLCFWKKNSEGWALYFIGSRPFDDNVNWSVFGHLAHYGQKVLDAKFELEDSVL